MAHLRRHIKLGPVRSSPTSPTSGEAAHPHGPWSTGSCCAAEMSRPADPDITGEGIRQRSNRYEHPVAGDLVRIDVRKVDRILNGGRWREHGRTAGAWQDGQRRVQGAHTRAAGRVLLLSLICIPRTINIPGRTTPKRCAMRRQ